VLLVEDNELDVFVIRDAVDRCNLNLQLVVVTDGEGAAAYLHGLAGDNTAPYPVLILLDLNIPKISGMEVLKRIRTGMRCTHTPVIVVSSSDAASDREAAKHLGAEAYFRKPADLTAYLDLCDVIKRVLPHMSHCPDA